MTTAYKHRPMSEILAPAAPTKDEGSTEEPAKEAPAPAAKPLDPKYEGKSVEDIIEMHRNAESRLGQVQNEVGSLRGLVTELSSVQRTPEVEQAPEVESVDVSGEDILSNPVEAVNRIVQPHLDAQVRQKELEKAEALLQTEGAALAQAYDVEGIVSTAEFQQFATRTPSRQADFQTAAYGEGIDQVRAARRLLEDYSDFQASVTTETKTGDTPVEAARKVATESGSVGAPISSKPKIHESDVIKLINSDPAKYRSPSFQGELLEAIKEGRFVKNS